MLAEVVKHEADSDMNAASTRLLAEENTNKQAAIATYLSQRKLYCGVLSSFFDQYR